MQATQRHLEDLCERVAALEKERDQLQSALEVSAREAQVEHVFRFVRWDHQFSNFQLSHTLSKQRIKSRFTDQWFKIDVSTFMLMNFCDHACGATEFQ